MDFVKRKLQGVIVNNELKTNIEKEAFDLFATAPDKREIPKINIQNNPKSPTPTPNSRSTN